MSRVLEMPVISIVDDDPAYLAAASDLVCSLGFRTRTFTSAKEFLKSAHLNQTSCLITDVQMPGMSGVDLQCALIERGSPVPIIFVTAFPEDATRSQALRNGAVCFLSKPFDARSLLKCLDKALKR